MELIRELHAACRRRPDQYNYDHLYELLSIETVISRALRQLKGSALRLQLINQLFDITVGNLVHTHLPLNTLFDQCTRVIFEYGLSTFDLPPSLQKHLKYRELWLEEIASDINTKAILQDPICCHLLGCDNQNRMVLCLLGRKYETDIPKLVICYPESAIADMNVYYFNHLASLVGFSV